MAELTVVLDVGRSGADGSHSPGDELTLPLMEAMALIEAGSAHPKSKKAYDAAKKKYEAAVEERKRIEEENRIRLERESYELKLRDLYAKVVDLEAALAGVRLDEAQRERMITALSQRDGRPAAEGGDGK